ncbi:geranylgeranyl reductase family protein [Candidatus Parcubacteria bacterium]|nr:geranylgeranyl reductase family protein [Candidatus Parcubacteria bacterium]
MRDVIIVGAGPAGTSTATFLGKKGYDVLLLEKEKFPRDKICGDGIGPTSLKYLKEMGIYDELFKEFQIINSALLSSPSGNEVNVKIPGSKALIIPRKKLDYILVKHSVKSGVELIEKFEVKEPLVENDKIIGIKGIYRNKEEIIKSKIVVAADGTHSIIGKRLTEKGRKSKNRYSAIAIRTYFDNVEDLKDCAEIHYEKSILPGYGWIFPINETSANVGIAMNYKRYKKQNKTIIQLFYDFINNNEYAKRKLKNAKMRQPLSGWMLSYDAHLNKKYHSGVLFVGDAASLVDPLSGEGIANALLSGKLAAQAIDSTLKTNDFSCLENYPKQWNKSMNPNLNAGLLLEYIMSYPFIINRFIKKATRDEGLAQILASCIAGTFPKTKMFSFNAIRRIIF